jgi:transposase
MLYASAGRPQGSRGKTERDWTGVHHELRRPGVTLMLLWEEYRQAEPDGYGYSRRCELYRTWEGRLSPTMRQAHPAGERMFVDYAGQTVELYDGRTGEVRQAQVCGFQRCRSVIPRSCRSLFRHDVARLRRPAGGLVLARSEL